MEVIFLSVIDRFDEFDDDEDDPSPLLPRDDRVWRHPSEMAGNFNSKDERILSQRRWLTGEPSKASAWTAGIVGALLASGLVLLGTHLATALSVKPPAPKHISASKVASTLPILGAVSYQGIPIIDNEIGTGLSAAMDKTVAIVTQSIVSIQAGFGTQQIYADGLILSSSGVIVTPATSVLGAQSIIVTTSGRTSYVGKIVGTDKNIYPYNSDLAVIKIEASGLAPVPLDNQEPLSTHQLVMALDVQNGRENVLTTTIHSLDTSQPHQWSSLIDSMTLNPTTGALVPGTAILDDSGGVVALVAGMNGHYPIAIPSSLITPTTNNIIMHKKILRGWLGIIATDTDAVTSSHYGQQGVLISSVYPHSAAAKYGLLKGELILNIDGVQVHTVNALMAQLYTKPPGAKVELVLLRKNRLIAKYVILADSPNSFKQ